MLYAILCYNSEAVVNAWSKEKDDAVMAHHQGVMRNLAAKGKLGPVARLMPTTTATTLRPGREALVLDGPFAETKEQLLGFYIVDCESLEEAIEIGKQFMNETGAMEIRPVMFFDKGSAAQ
ncbi:MAG: YciI family protein [Steroidobacteraceae bacterium]|nr:YciI family protein [Steroidobacteraceae bacterium]